MNQHEITERRPLLDASGNLTEPGYAKSLLPVYRRGDIKANKLRIKEWDYYCINNGHFALALTIADNSYMGLDSISLLNLDEGWEITKSPMKAFTNGKVCLPESSERGDVHSAGRNYSILFKNEGDRRVLIAQMKNFGPEGSLYAKVTLTDIPAESMVIATPFDKDKHFYYNQKINCMRAEGTVTYGYHNRTYTFDPADSFAVLDWGRGVWTYKNTWYWGSASGLVDGERFGFNIGYGFGNTSAASENMLFYKGRAHKLSQVIFHIPGDGGRATPDYMRPWTFTSDDGRFEMDYTPVLDRASCSDVGLIKSDQHQVFGVFNGRAVLDDGTVLNVKDLELAARQQRRHGVDDHDVERAGAHELLRDLERLLAGVRLGDEQAVDVHAEGTGVSGLERVLHVDERDLAALFLGAGEDVQRERRLTGRLGPIDLDDAAAGHAADAEREVERQGAGGDGLHVHGNVVAEAHDGALAEVLLDLGERGLERFFLVLRLDGAGGHGCGFFLFSHSDSPLSIRCGRRRRAGCRRCPRGRSHRCIFLLSSAP